MGPLLCSWRYVQLLCVGLFFFVVASDVPRNPAARTVKMLPKRLNVCGFCVLDMVCCGRLVSFLFCFVTSVENVSEVCGIDRLVGLLQNFVKVSDGYKIKESPTEPVS